MPFRLDRPHRGPNEPIPDGLACGNAADAFFTRV
ncbi:hypothetical protein SAMN04489712_11117 [Thermomonospora echinospora]|uniref:Uncharacterized protein n=1 Tax=Thermomonospora echinospora TaxID=1992 RepID=A0A1H6CQP5_9ACTN|nr:hypothetical protein SAMN04489712_11117 [Thermomonospora echinospora]